MTLWPQAPAPQPVDYSNNIQQLSLDPGMSNNTGMGDNSGMGYPGMSQPMSVTPQMGVNPGMPSNPVANLGQRVAELKRIGA